MIVKPRSWQSLSLISVFVFACGDSWLASRCLAQRTPPESKKHSTISGSTKEAEPGEPFKFTNCLVIAPETYAISSQETGVLRELLVEENSHVEPGQVLIRLDADVLNLEVGIAELQHQVATTEAKDDSDIKFADMVVEETKLLLDAYEDMGKKREASILEIRQKRITWEQAKVKAIQARSAGTQKLLKAKLAGATLELTKKKIASLSLTAPVYGQVTKVEQRPGEWVSAGGTLLQIIRLDKLRVDFFVDLKQDNPADYVGKKAEVLLEQSETPFIAQQPFPAQIIGYAPEVSSAGRLRVSALVENRRVENDWGLLPGMKVSLQSRSTDVRE